MKTRQVLAHMEAAYVYARLSYCVRRKVGCVIIKNDRVISIGYNGTAPGEDNCCEDESNATKPTVLHAEYNAISKLDFSREACENAILFVTTAPCRLCAELIVKAGIPHVVYDDMYRNEAGIQYLIDHNVIVTQINLIHKQQ